MSSTQSKVWFIIGAGRGFGRIWANAALQRGDKVAATARDIGALAPLLEEFGDAVLPLALDVTHRDAVIAAVGQSQATFGRLDIARAGRMCHSEFWTVLRIQMRGRRFA